LVGTLVKVLGTVDGRVVINLIKVTGQIVKVALVHKVQIDPDITGRYGIAATMVVHSPHFVVDAGF
jgi:hypothetical protein